MIWIRISMRNAWYFFFFFPIPVHQGDRVYRDTRTGNSMKGGGINSFDDDGNSCVCNGIYLWIVQYTQVKRCTHQVAWVSVSEGGRN